MLSEDGAHLIPSDVVNGVSFPILSLIKDRQSLRGLEASPVLYCHGAILESMPFLSCAFAVSSSNATRLKSFGYTRQAIKSRRGSHIACLSLLLQSAVMFSGILIDQKMFCL